MHIVCVAVRFEPLEVSPPGAYVGQWVATVAICGPLTGEECTFPGSELLEAGEDNNLTKSSLNR